MLEFFGVVEVRRGKDGGLVVAVMDPEGTIGSALLYLDYAGIDSAQAGELLGLLRAALRRGGTPAVGGNRALELFEGVLTRFAAAAPN